LDRGNHGARDVVQIQVELMQKLLIGGAIVLAIFITFFSGGKVEYEAGVLVKTDPVQEDNSC
jgi:hypothetical protein